MPDGFLSVDKPPGMTSHDVVARIRRVLKTKRVGHAGTLDPDATGVLLVAIGQATRLLPYVPTEPKEYIARIVFGSATDTEDAGGAVTEEKEATFLSESTIQAVLPRFLGTISQVPPMVSAVHHEGRRLYELAREGKVVEREARPVVIHALRLSDFAGGTRAEARLEVSCGGGTYIRTLCKDIGLAVGVPAHMKTLIREAVGPFRREAAIPLSAIEAAALLPVESVLPYPAVQVTQAQAERLERGQAVVAQERFDSELTMLLYQERLLALAHWKQGEFHPFRVFPRQGSRDE